MRVEVTNQIRGILKTFGIVLSRRTGEPFERLVIEALASVPPEVKMMASGSASQVPVTTFCLREAGRAPEFTGPKKRARTREAFASRASERSTQPAAANSIQNPVSLPRAAVIEIAFKRDRSNSWCA
jgi:hypothetical protein